MPKRWIATIASLSLLVVSPAAAASLAGKSCKKAGSTTRSGSTTFTCVKSGKKLVWKAKSTASAAPSKPVTPTPPVTPVTPVIPGAVTLKDPVAYPKVVTPSYPTETTLTAPSGLRDPQSNNVRLFIADPVTPTSPLAGSGVFYSGNSVPWTYAGMNSDGSLLLNLQAGSYQFDIVETGANQIRKRYTVTVPSSGNATISGLTANANGYIAVTVDVKKETLASVKAKQDALTALANEPASTFTPTSPCQLVDQATPQRSFATDLSAGFPKVRTRLQSFGHIRALIVPIDFTDIQGKDDTVTYFSPIAKDVRDFYFAQSYGRLAFDWEIVPDWVRANFSSTYYGTGGGVGAGNPDGYRRAVIAMTERAIDYSQYDAVVFLVPKEMPMANMGWGPAITSPTWTNTGYIINGATGGADMYFVENNGTRGGRWKWMAHELGHAFGLYDEDWKHESQTLGFWSIMAMSWSNQAIELGAWDRYLQGWLPESQVNCVTSVSGATYTLEPLVRQAGGLKAVLVPLSKSKILVIESRKNEGIDRLTSREAGVLVYTVDVSIGQLSGGYRIVAGPSSTDKQNFTDGTLKSGEQVTVDGVIVKVISLGADGDQVQVSKG